VHLDHPLAFFFCPFPPFPWYCSHAKEKASERLKMFGGMLKIWENYFRNV
jgi:hypothetical protein